MHEPSHSPAIETIPEVTNWARTLKKIGAEPLTFCQDFPQIARRFEAWWSQDLVDRPIFIGKANTNPNRPVTRRLELLAQPEAWLETKQADMGQFHRVGDALPNIRVDFGPVLLGGLLGGEREIGSDTSWTHAFINDDWSNAPDWSIAETNEDWALLQKLLRLVAADAAGRYLLCTPDLGGSADVLLNLRGSGNLGLDVITQPEQVKSAIEAIYPSWRRVFVELYEATLPAGAGLIHWLELWSDRPYMVPACDFSALVGPEHFNRLLRPDIARQAASVGRGAFHLDGPDAARHIDALLEVEHLQVIQFTPGAGTPSALAWVEMFKKIQQRGRSLLIFCPAAEVLALSDALAPEGLAIIVEGALTPHDLDDLFERFCRKY